MDLLSSHPWAGGFTGDATSRDVPVPRLRLAVYVAHDHPEVPTDWIESLQRFCGQDVTVIVLASHAISPPPSNPRSAVPRRGGLAPGVKRRVFEHIDRDLARPIVLGELAVIAGLSSYHFARAFKQSVGLPPYRYVVRRRIAAAAELVKNTKNPLSAIAIDVGFSDQSHFTRLFVRHMGETPSAFRRRHR
jgi:AraC-like DNA-binding protein